ncbi:MAG: TlpA disulfide reductase family protein [Bacteroidota bacterium]
MKASLLTFILLLSTLFCFAEDPYKCTLKGVVINRDSKRLILKKYTDHRDIPGKKIAIENNAFEYTFDVDVTEGYQLIFEDEFNSGVYNPILFFPVAGLIEFKLHPQQQYKSNEIKGGKLNADYLLFKTDMENQFTARSKSIYAKQAKLEKLNQYYSPERDSLIKLSNTIDHDKLDPSVYRRLGEIDRTGEGLTAQGKSIKKEHDDLEAERRQKRYSYIAANISEATYQFIIADLQAAKNNDALRADISNVFPKFEAIYPNHPYSQLAGSVLVGYNKVKVGQQLANLSLPDLSGNIYTLQALSKDKYTLIDFWGSWCGPCIAATRTMLPVYQDFKDKGFAIVGIAKEYKTTKALQIALKREKYPWLNLVELDDKNGIWNKFGITTGTGMMLLVDKQGKIVAVDPSAEEVRKVLAANL